jgi:uncharacterized protein
MEKTQIVFIHGGDARANNEEFYAFLRTIPYNPYAVEQKKWRENIKEVLSTTHECLLPRMPNAMQADYTAWSIWFEKIIPYLRDGVILVGHSLGGGFLLRYLTEHTLPVSIAQLHLVAPVIDDVDCPGVDGFTIDIAATIDTIHLWHSRDDDSVPIHHSERLAVKCPEPATHYFEGRGHFLQSEFPELLAVIQN